MLQACDVGHRVVVRHRVATGPQGRPLLTDVLGELDSIGADQLVVRSDDGVSHVIPSAAVSAARRVPPRPPRYSEMLALERVADRAWPAPEHEALGGWYLRAAQGWTARGNSVLPLGDPGPPLDEALAACAAWYAERDLRPRVTVPLPVRRDLAEALAARGWAAAPPVLVQAATLATPPGPSAATGPTAARSDPATDPGPATGAGDAPGVVELLDQPSPGFLARVAERKRGLPPAALQVLTGVRPVCFAEVRDGDEVIAVARGAVVEAWLHVGLVEVAPAARRRGLARALYRSMAAWSAPLGATRVVLQVEERNTPAVALYAGLGLRTHHRYVTYAAP